MDRETETPQKYPASSLGSANSVGSGRYYELGRMSRGLLEKVFLRGQMPALDSLAGFAFRGMNQPAWAKVLGIKKFIKGFYWEGDKLYGYNCPVVQDAVTMPWQSKPAGEVPKRFGFFQVAPVDPRARDNAYLHSVLLDYGKGGNKGYDATRNLRDYLVQVDKNNPDLYLGKAYYALGPVRLSTNFFLLERLRSVLEPVMRPGAGR